MGVQALFAMSRGGGVNSTADDNDGLHTTFRLLFQKYSPYAWPLFNNGRDDPTPLLRPEVVECCKFVARNPSSDDTGLFFAEERGRLCKFQLWAVKHANGPLTDMFGELNSDKPNSGNFTDRTWQNTILVFTGDGAARRCVLERQTAEEGGAWHF
jgi:hypothetical protein